MRLAMACAVILLNAVAFSQEPDSLDLTLADCYALALKQSETIALRQELIAETEARFTQARSGILPRVTFSSSDKRQDGTGGSAFTLKEVPERKLVFNQPLFSGFKEFAAMNVTKAQRRQRTFEKAHAEQILLVDVSEAFYLLLEQRRDLDALEKIREAFFTRIAELKEREWLGRSHPSEVVRAEAKRLRLEAQMEQVRSQEITARQLLEFLTARVPIGPIRDEGSWPLADEETYLDQWKSRPDVLAAKERQEAAAQEIRVAQAKRWPTVGLEGNYFAERVGAAKEVEWDAALKVDLPIFQGGQARGAIDQAASQARQAGLSSSEVKRRALLEIQDLYAKLQAAMAQEEALTKAVEAADENFRFQVEDYRRSLVNNLDVLEALQELQEVRRDLIRAQYEFRRLYWRLKAAVGEKP